MTLSGSILLYKEEIINSSLCIQKNSISILNKSAFINNINKLAHIKSIIFTKSNYYYIVSLKNKKKLYFQSDNSQILDCRYIDITNFLSKLHYTFFISKYFICFIGISICFLLISGFYMIKKFKIRNLHMNVGFISFPFLLIFILSGSFLPLKSIFIKTFFNEYNTYPSVKLVKNDTTLDFDKLYKKFSKEIKNGRITRIYFQKNNSSEYIFRIKYLKEVHPNGKSYLVVNPSTYKIIENIDARKHHALIGIVENIYTFHSAKYENKIYTFFVFLISLILIFLCFRVLKR